MTVVIPSDCNCSAQARPMMPPPATMAVAGAASAGFMEADNISYTVSIRRPSLSKPLWQGVYPAATSQFAPDLSLDIPACRKTLTALVADGVDGLVLLGTVGENNSLRPEEKRLVLRAGIDAVGGRVPLVAGVSELTTDRAVEFARDAEKIGIDALMVLPAMVYVPTPEEIGRASCRAGA